MNADRKYSSSSLRTGITTVKEQPPISPALRNQPKSPSNYNIRWSIIQHPITNNENSTHTSIGHTNIFKTCGRQTKNFFYRLNYFSFIFLNFTKSLIGTAG